MAHGDDKGLRLPPAVAPVQAVVVPIYRSDEEMGRVLEVAAKVRDGLVDAGVRARLDDRDQYRPGYKFSEWELKGVPVRIEIGPRDVDADEVTLARRDSAEKEQRSTSDAVAGMTELLASVQGALYRDALSFRETNTHEAGDIDEMIEGLDRAGGFWIGAWCGDLGCEQRVTEASKATIRVLPLEREDPDAACVVCGKAGTERATWARAY